MAGKLVRISTRFKTLREFDAVRRAAKLSRLSINEFVIRSAYQAAQKALSEVTKSVVDNNVNAA